MSIRITPAAAAPAARWVGRCMRRGKSKAIAVGLAGLLPLLLAGCDQPEPPPFTRQRDPNQIIIGTTAKVTTLDPADAYTVFAGNVLLALGDRLYTYKPGTTELQPQLATALPQVSSDGLTYRMPLRRGVVFQDGTPFNAEAMRFSLQRFIENGGRPAFLLKNVVADIQATGDYELTIRLQKPFAPFPRLLAFSGLCAVSPQAYRIGAGQFQPRMFVGTGPYQLVSFGSDALKLKRFPQYWGTPPASAQLDIQFLSSSANLYNALQTGAVDVAYQFLEPEQIKKLQAQADIQTVSSDGTGINYLSLNRNQPPLDQQAVRQALALVMPRQLLQERVFQNLVEPAFSLVPSRLPGYQPVFRVPAEPPPAGRARELLSQAGITLTQPVRIDLWYRSNLPSHIQVVSTLKAVIEREIPVQLIPQPVDSTTAYQNLEKGIYPMFLLDWYPDFLDADNYLEPLMSCQKGTLAEGCLEGSSRTFGSFYYSPQANDLIAQSRRSTDPQQRLALLGQLQKLMAVDVPYIPLWQNREFVFARADVQGVRLEPTQTFPFWLLKKAVPAP
ncbi:MAG: ABC transporter substrate-binding protein [Gloeomargarita sp. DG02_1_bins_92]